MRRKPNGYGCVTKLKGNRSKPWIVKITIYDKDGKGYQKAIGYAKTETEGLNILADYNQNIFDIDRDRYTLLDVFQKWKETKCGTLGTASQASLKSAFNYMQKLYGMKYRDIRTHQMQEIIDSCERSYSTKNAIKSLWGHLDNIAFELDIINKKYSENTKSAPIPPTSRKPFTKEQILVLWQLKDVDFVDVVLILIYTGLRLNELINLKASNIDTENWYLTGGSKTKAGIDRIVPIHDRIKPFIKKRLESGSVYLISENGKMFCQTIFYRHWRYVMDMIGASGLTPHCARHTFETELDNKNGNRKCIDMLMGHTSKDVGNRVYNHKTIEQLRETIELLD